MASYSENIMIVARPFLASLLLAGAAASCHTTKLIPGRCEKPADCSGGLTCDDHQTCVPAAPGPSPCSSSDQCGSGYTCDNLQWCVCQNQGFSADNDPCADGRLPTYRGVETDGGVDGGDGGDGGDAGDGGDGGFKCKANGDCSGTTPACRADGVCVGCLGDNDCVMPAKPICNVSTNTCGPCMSDSECVARFPSNGPGVCMAHQDGHCATDDETVYVQNIPACVALGSTGAGTADKPFCTIQAAIASLATRSLIVVRGTIAGSTTVQSGSLSIVGQQGAKISPATAMPGLQVSGSSLYMRGVRVSAGDDVGINAGSASTLSLDTVVVDNCAGGGILIDGAAFDIKNTKVMNNSSTPIMHGTYYVGGILIANPLAAGPSKLHLVTIQGNGAPGLQCSTSIMGDGVFATGNSTDQISPACGITACSPAGQGCGTP
jgi:hypothetical protein